MNTHKKNCLLKYSTVFMAQNNNPRLFQVPPASSAPDEAQASIAPAFSETPFKAHSFKQPQPVAAPSKSGGHTFTKELLNNQTKILVLSADI